MTHEGNGESDKAIRDYTQEMALNPLGRGRLADAYCTRGFRLQQKKNYAAAVVEYQKSIEFGAASNDVCPYEPYESLVAIYTTEMHQHERKSGLRIRSELVDKLKKHSGRTD